MRGARAGPQTSDLRQSYLCGPSVLCGKKLERAMEFAITACPAHGFRLITPTESIDLL